MRFYSYDSTTGRLVSAGTLNGSDANPMYSYAQEQAQELQRRRRAGEIIDSALLAAFEAEPQFIMPAHATPLSPPDVPEGHFARFVDGAWTIEAEPMPEPIPEPEPAAAADSQNAEHVPAPELTEAQKRLQAAEAALEEHMQAMARGAGYKSLEAVVSYADEPAVPKYQEEGQKFRRWRSLTWDWFYSAAVQATVADGSFMPGDLNTLTPRLNP
jgi:hypothetical protein